MYLFYINGVQLPITPSKIDIKTKSNNKEINLINEGDVSVLKSPGLKEISFKALLPRRPYPFSSKIFLPLTTYEKGFEVLKVTKKVFQFIIVRIMPDGSPLMPTNIKCTLEDYTVNEDANNGFDVEVTIKLKQYKHYGLKEVKIEETKASVKNTRSIETAPNNQSYKVKKGDSLHNIAKQNLGDGSRWKEIYELNKDKISDPNLIYPDQVLVMPTR